MNLERLLKDNNNLSSAALSRLTGKSRFAIERLRTKLDLQSNWRHRGVGLPFTHQSVNEDGVYLSLQFKGRVLAKGKIEGVMINLDRLIYCLENNKGNLPPTLSEWSLSGLTFAKDSAYEV